jgi:hypothetical protein
MPGWLWQEGWERPGSAGRKPAVEIENPVAQVYSIHHQLFALHYIQGASPKTGNGGKMGHEQLHGEKPRRS